MAAGTASNQVEYGDSRSPFQDQSFTLRTRTWEADGALLFLAKPFPMLSFYCNAGITRGGIAYGFGNPLDSNAARIEGSVPLRGFKTHIGAVLEFKDAEIALEQGFLFYDRGFIPSLGLRWSFKDAWKR